MVVIKWYQRSKNSGLVKCLVVLWESILWTSTSLLTVSLYLSEPDKRMANNILSFKFFKETYISNKLFGFCLFSAKDGQHKKKWSVFSVSKRQSHLGLGASLKLWRNLYSLKWLHFNRSLDNNLKPTESWVALRDLCFKLTSSLNIDWRGLIFLSFWKQNIMGQLLPHYLFY